MNRDALRNLHLKQVRKGQKTIERAVFSFIAQQLQRVIENIRGGLIDSQSPIDVQTETEALKAKLRPLLGKSMYEASFVELARLPSSKTSAQDAISRYGLQVPDFIATELPAELIRLIESELDETFAEDYWQAINETTRDDLRRIIGEGITEGESIPSLTRRIQRLTGTYARSRAIAVARTESSRSRNAGHEAGIRLIQAETGIQTSKEWLSVLGSTTRDSHAALDGVVVPSDGEFNVGGTLAPYPSHRSLPPEQAINCQCTIVSSFGE